MTKYRIYYRKDPSFRVDKTLTKSKVNSSSFTTITTVDLAGKVSHALDRIFASFQGETMTTLVLRKIRNKGGLHTSMSVGDCIENVETGAIYQCANTGWARVPNKR